MKPQRFTDARHGKAFRDLDRAVAFERNGLLAEADNTYANVIKKNPQYFDALHLYGLFKFKNGQLSDAVRLIEKACKQNPNSLNALNSLGVVWAHLKNYDRALQTLNKIIERDENNVQALSNKAQCLNELGRFQESVDVCNKLLSLDRFRLDAYVACGAALLELGIYDQALLNYQKVVEFNPRHEMGWSGIGNVLHRLRRYDEAFASYDKALSIKPNLEDAWLGRGNVFYDLKRYDEAFAAYDKALSIKPGLENAWLGRGNVFCDLKRYEEAFAAYDKALSIKPDLESVEGLRLHMKMHVCNWQQLDKEVGDLTNSIRAGKANCPPFVLLSLTDLPDDHLRCARAWVRAKNPIIAKSVWRNKAYKHDKIRLGYVSADLRTHPIGYLTAGLFESHNSNRFETYAFSIGPNDNSDLRNRLEGSFYKFFDLNNRSDSDILSAIRSAEIDILVDLNGHTQGGRSALFANRPAEIIVNYLGFAGTIGGDFCDYVIADRMVVPEGCQRFFSEKLVYLPHCFMPHDDKGRAISDRLSNRADHQLPEHGLVFCCFNNAYKINPGVFKCWMHILSSSDSSVLWLSDMQATAKANLCEEAEKLGIDRDRLVFAKHLASPADHLVRHRLADLFLDTLPYNAHTTATDALWAGLPVLTQIGNTFAGRVAASLLNAIGLPEMITYSREEYEALAIELALSKEKLQSIRDKLARNRLTTPLFDTPLYTKHLEAAYEAMYQRYRDGLPPDHIEIAPIKILQ